MTPMSSHLPERRGHAHRAASDAPDDDTPLPSRSFLTAEWRWLAMLNYRIDPAHLEPLRPAGTELDEWNGESWISLVGFLFRDTRVLGIPIPWHRHFEEVNLRFYVRRRVEGEIRRGVTFVRELVPRAAVAWAARLAYNEPYRTLRMSHRIEAPAPDAAPTLVRYAWRHAGRWNGLTVVPSGSAQAIAPGSGEEFITEHYWGYTRQRDGGTVEYQVEHPRWRVWQVSDARLDGATGSLYDPVFAELLSRPPDSAFLAEGSQVLVRTPIRLIR